VEEAVSPLRVKDREAMQEIAKSDTGWLARNVLGYDYDLNDEDGKMVRPGGIRAEGPHREMTDFLDRRSSKAKHLEAPRGSYKSTILTAYCIRRALENPDIRILYGMETFKNALGKTRTIQKQFEENPKLIELFGDLKTSEWGRDQFTIKGRTRVVDQPTFQAFGLERVVTGSHFDLIILDDLVSWQNARTKDGLEKPKNCLKDVESLRDPGCEVIIVGTRYHDDDLYNHILTDLEDQFETLVLDAGVELDFDPDGKQEAVLMGEPSFSHLTMDVLSKKLKIQGTAYFSAQYLNRCLSAADQLFYRAQFKQEHWAEWMDGMNAYILTDTATSDHDDGCYSVVAMVMIDGDDIAYVADLVVGQWRPHRVSNEILGMIERWEDMLRIKGVVMEKIGLNKVYRGWLEQEAKKRKLSLRIFDIPRGVNIPGKKQRIRGLQPRFEAGRIRFLNTIPRYCNDGKSVLFDPAGYRGDNGEILPGGELVDQFIRFPMHKFLDIPDALADLEAIGMDGRQVVQRTFGRGKENQSSSRPRMGRYAPDIRKRGMKSKPSANGSSHFWKDLARRAENQQQGSKIPSLWR